MTDVNALRAGSASPGRAAKRSRREQAADTRERIMRAAIEVFQEQGYVGARMADIGKRAGVAVQTVYFAFHTKPELLQACWEYAVLGPEKLPPPLQSWNQGIRKARSGRAMLRAFAAGNVEIAKRAAGLDQVARAAVHEPEARAILERSETLRRAGLRDVIVELDQRFGLRPGLDIDRATDILLTINSPLTYLTLTGYGWSGEEFAEWAAEACATQLLAKPGTRSAR